MRLVPFILLLFFAQQEVVAQTHSIDSLEKHISTNRLDTTKVIALNQLATAFREKDGDKALQYAEQGLLLAERLRYAKGMGQILANMSLIHYRRGSLSIAFECATRVLKIADSASNNALTVTALNTIAVINLQQKQFETSLKNLKAAFRVSKVNADMSGMGLSLNNIALTFLEQSETDSAAIYARRGLKISRGSGDRNVIAQSFRTMGDIFFKTGDIDQAIENYQQCLKEANIIEDIYLKVSTFYRLAELYNYRMEPALAIPYLLEGIQLSKKFGYNNELESIFKVMAESQALLGDDSSAYYYQGRYIRLHDSIYSRRNSEQLALMQAKFEDELKEAQIELLLKDAQISQQEIVSQKVWLSFSIGFLSLALIFAFVLYDNYRRIKSINRTLENKNGEIQAQAKQLSNLNITKDKLFSIIGHDLRTPVASLRALMSIIGNSTLSQEEFVSIIGKLKRRLDSVYDDLDNLLQWAQSQLKGLQARPESFDIRILAEEKIELFRETARHKKVKLINEIEEGSYALADKNHISLVLRNLLTNAIKFTPHGGSVRIQCIRKGRQFEISVSDSGIGISLADLNKLFNAQTHFTRRGTHEEKGIGIGLLLTKEFVESNGGSIWVSSELGKGSTFTFAIKCDPKRSMMTSAGENTISQTQ